MSAISPGTLGIRRGDRFVPAEGLDGPELTVDRVLDDHHVLVRMGGESCRCRIDLLLDRDCYDRVARAADRQCVRPAGDLVEVDVTLRVSPSALARWGDISRDMLEIPEIKSVSLDDMPPAMVRALLEGMRR